MQSEVNNNQNFDMKSKLPDYSKRQYKIIPMGSFISQ
jgi:hypothetical protein